MYTADELIQWLQNWVDTNYKKNPKDIPHVLIMTIDNPGWGVTINYANHLSNKKLTLADVQTSENDWYYCVIRNSKFEGDGGLFNLTDILHIFKQLFNYDVGKNHVNNDLGWLLQWFASQCDGDWEHEHGVRIETLDNPGWCLKISVRGTELENKKFERTAIERSERDWLFCFIDEGHFEAACGLHNLSEVLNIFRNWAES